MISDLNQKSHLIQVSTCNNASTPIAANIAAAMEWTIFIGILLEKRSPTKTAGTSAISMPSVVVGADSKLGHRAD